MLCFSCDEETIIVVVFRRKSVGTWGGRRRTPIKKYNREHRKFAFTFVRRNEIASSEPVEHTRGSAGAIQLLHRILQQEQAAAPCVLAFGYGSEALRMRKIATKLSFSHFTLLVACIVLLPVAAFAQQTLGGITGTVTTHRERHRGSSHPGGRRDEAYPFANHETAAAATISSVCP